jgi:hypothetical protein
MGRKDILPICCKQGSLGEGLPARDLWISPHHAMFFDGLLIEAKDIVNGVSIVQMQDVDAVEYFHIELDSHDVIFAEGALSETFVDDDNRDMFYNAYDFALLNPEAIGKPARYCAPRVEAGYQLVAARRQIAERAGLAVVKDGRSAVPLRGYVDRVTPERLEGWAQNPEHPEAPVCLEIVLGERVIGQVLANRYREDLAEAGLGSGRHSFSFELPVGVILSRETLKVRRPFDGAILPVSSPVINGTGKAA